MKGIQRVTRFLFGGTYCRSDFVRWSKSLSWSFCIPALDYRGEWSGVSSSFLHQVEPWLVLSLTRCPDATWCKTCSRRRIQMNTDKVWLTRHFICVCVCVCMCGQQVGTICATDKYNKCYIVYYKLKVIWLRWDFLLLNSELEQCKDSSCDASKWRIWSIAEISNKSVVPVLFHNVDSARMKIPLCLVSSRK